MRVRKAKLCSISSSLASCLGIKSSSTTLNILKELLKTNEQIKQSSNSVYSCVKTFYKRIYRLAGLSGRFNEHLCSVLKLRKASPETNTFHSAPEGNTVLVSMRSR